MSKFVVTVFDSEKAAYEGAQALQDLDRDGDVSVYGAAVIEKEAGGAVSVKSAADEGAIGTATGMLVGGMMGVLGGPAGMLAGSSLGALSGMWFDIWNTGVDGQFVTDVGDALDEGKFAVVAEVSEGWQTPLDTKMEALGGQVHRRWRIDVEDQQCEREAAAYDREIAELKEEKGQAKDDKQIAAVEKKMEAARGSLKSLQGKASKKIASLQAQLEAKSAKLNEQLKSASDDRKSRIESKCSSLQNDFNERISKLKEANKLAEKALS